MEEELKIQWDEVNWKIVIRDLLKNAWLILLSVMIAFMGVQIYKDVAYTPEYTASATLAVSVRGNANSSIYFSLTTANEIAEVYASVFDEKVTRDKVAEAIGGALPSSAAISASVIPETNLMILQVKAATPRDAYLTLKSVLDNYQSISDYLFGNAVLEVIMQPQVPIAPSNAFQSSRMTKLAMLAAAVLMSGIIVLFTLTRKTVKTARAAKRNLAGERLAIIPYEAKNKTLKTKLRKDTKALLLTNPIIGFRFEESFYQLASRLEYRIKKEHAKTVLITSVAENEGKSTVAINLAIALAKRNKRVVIIDADLLKPALYKFILGTSVPHACNLMSYFSAETTLKNTIGYYENFNIYAVLNDRHIENSQKYLNSERFRLLVKACTSVFDYVILDAAPLAAGTAAEKLNDIADASVLVVHQDRSVASDINDAMETLKEGNADFLGYVLNKFDEKLNFQSGYGYGRGYGYGYGNYGRYNNKKASGEGKGHAKE